MLVVLGIILILMGMLIPVIISAQRQSKITQCQTRLRSLGQALQVYMTEFDQTLPPGITSNSMDSSMSMAALGHEKEPVTDGMMQGFRSKSTLQYMVGAENFPQPSPPVAYLLKKIVPLSEGNWSCPTWRRGKPGKVRTYQFVMTENLGNDDLKEGPLAGSLFGTEEFRPGYLYMSGVEYTYSINKGSKGDAWHSKMSSKYSYGFLRDRSISGLKMSEIKPAGLAGPLNESVVTFADYNPAAHSKNLLELAPDKLPEEEGSSSADPPGEKDSAGSPTGPTHTANFLFLDGHVETRTFKGYPGYLAQLHGSIRQPW